MKNNRCSKKQAKKKEKKGGGGGGGGATSIYKKKKKKKRREGNIGSCPHVPVIYLYASTVHMYCIYPAILNRK